MSTTLDMEPEGAPDPVHLLAIGTTKAGKSTYIADTALVGFRVLVLDSDNGKSAIKKRIGDNKEALSRIHYFHTSRPAEFLVGFLRAGPYKYIWNRTLDRPFSQALTGQTPDDEVWVFTPSKMPKDVVIAQDSWTALSADCLGIGAKSNSVDVIDMGDSSQSVFGDASARATAIANMIQKHPNHWIVIAHDTFYERYSKPEGKQTKDIKQKEMKLEETTQIPVSTTRPNGYSMGSKFNHIGWVTVNNMGESEIDFTRRPNRIGGGPPNRKDKVGKLNFRELVGYVPEDSVDPEEWIRSSTAKEFLRESKPSGPVAAKAPQANVASKQTASANPTSAQATLSARPNGLLNFGKK